MNAKDSGKRIAVTKHTGEQFDKCVAEGATAKQQQMCMAKNEMEMKHGQRINFAQRQNRVQK